MGKPSKPWYLRILILTLCGSLYLSMWGSYLYFNAEVVHNAMLGLGRIGAGTNNARLAAVLRQNNLFMVKIAQGLVHLGKGTLSLNPFHSDRQLMSPVAVSWQFSSHSLMSRLPF